MTKTCDVCGSVDMVQVHDFGSQPLCNDLRPEAPRFPLMLVRCGDCRLLQLYEVPPGSVVFPKTYPYRSRSTDALRRNFREMWLSIYEYISIRPVDLVVDVGSNDGTSLLEISVPCRRLGIEPTSAALDAAAAGIQTANEPFSERNARSLANIYGQARVASVSNVLAHAADPHDFVRGVEAMLASDGVFVSESAYVGDLVEGGAWDTIYHEHRRYYGVADLRRLFAEHGLRIFRVHKIASHGGSVRVFAARDRGEDVEVVGAYEVAEHEMRIDELSGRIRRSIQEIRDRTLNRGDAMAGLAAPSRAGALVSACGLTTAHLSCVYERVGSPKIGGHMPGTVIPIVDEALLFAKGAPALLVLAHHVGDELAALVRAKGYRGEICVPLPWWRRL